MMKNIPFESERYKLIYNQLHFALIGNVFISAILVFILWNEIPHNYLVIWFVILMLSVVLRAFHLYVVKKDLEKYSSQPISNLLLFSGVVMGGIIWGSVGVFLFPADSIMHQTFITLILAGMVTASAGTFSAILPLFVVLSILLIIPLTIHLILLGDEMHLALSGMVLFFGAMMFDIAKRNNKATLYILRLKQEKELQNIDLIEINDKLKAEMQEKLTLEAQLHQSQKMEAIGTLAGGIAHDFNNILASILGNIELALIEIPEGSPVNNYLKVSIRASLRARDLVQHILTYSHTSTQKDSVQVKITAVTKEFLNFFRSSIPTSIEIRGDINENCGLILGDPVQIHQVLINLCTNASLAMEEKGGVLELSLEPVELSSEDGVIEQDVVPGHYIKLTVRDNGRGIPRNILDRIFDPYFTTRETGKGTGMGLSIVHGIIKQHGGFITVESKPDKGTVFHVFFPVIVGRDEEESIAEDASATGGHERILLVDDEDDIVKLGKQMFERLGYSVTIQRSASDAFTLFQEDPYLFDLVITDQTMPGMRGTELSQEMLKINPDIPILLCSGYTNEMEALRSQDINIKAIVAKPFSMNEFAKLVRKVLDEELEKRK